MIVGLHLTAMLGLNPAHRQICVRNIVQFNLSKKYLRRVDDGLCHSPLVCDSTTVVNYSSKSVTIHLQSKASGCGTVRSYRLFLTEL